MVPKSVRPVPTRAWQPLAVAVVGLQSLGGSLEQKGAKEKRKSYGGRGRCGRPRRRRDPQVRIVNG